MNKEDPKKTSWGKVSKWYDDLLEKGDDTYQEKIILPNILRLLDLKKNTYVLDLACGQGFFSREFHKAGARVVGVDIGGELIEIARKKSSKDIEYHVAPADKLSFLDNESIDSIVCILALQNIENVMPVIKESARVLKKGSNFFFVINHPAFRVPKESYWAWDDKMMIQYRRIDRYLSESKVVISMHPGKDAKQETLSFHRPLQFYFKALRKAGFAVIVLEEWNSHKVSESGPRKSAEDRARKEIPLFLCVGAKKLE